MHIVLKIDENTEIARDEVYRKTEAEIRGMHLYIKEYRMNVSHQKLGKKYKMVHLWSLPKTQFHQCLDSRHLTPKN